MTLRSVITTEGGRREAKYTPVLAQLKEEFCRGRPTSSLAVLLRMRFTSCEVATPFRTKTGEFLVRPLVSIENIRFVDGQRTSSPVPLSQGLLCE
jgi:hypothetical protein